MSNKQMVGSVLVLMSMVGGVSEASVPSVHRVSVAIARAEGFYVRGSVANRLHNPGNLRTRNPHAYRGQVGLWHNFAVFATDRDGWKALDGQVARMVGGKSRIYNARMTFAEIGAQWAGKNDPWGRNVAKYLNVTPNLTLAAYLGVPSFGRNLSAKEFNDVLRMLDGGTHPVQSLRPVPKMQASVHQTE